MDATEPAKKVLQSLPQFEAEKNEVEDSFYKFVTEIEDGREVLAAKDRILFERENQNLELKNAVGKKEKEIKNLQKVISKLGRDISEFKAVESRCSAISSVLNQ